MLRRGGRGLAVLTTALALVLLALALRTADAHPGQTPLPSAAFLARADVPVDALAAGPIAALFGGPVLLTPSDHLGDQARQRLEALRPDIVFLAGGEAALAPAVRDAVEDMGFVVLRIAGEERTETAAELSALPGSYGVGRPVLTEGLVTGGADIEGELHIDTLIVDDNRFVENLHADLLDGRHARQLAHPPLTMQGLAELRPATDDVTVTERPEGRRLLPDSAGSHTLVADVTAPVTSSNAPAPLFGRLVEVELCYRLMDAGDPITGVQVFVLGAQRAANSDVVLDGTAAGCEEIALDPVDAQGPVRLALTWEPGAGGAAHALDVFGLRTTWETASPS